MSEPTQPVPVFETKKWVGGLIIGLLLAETALVLIGSLVRDVIFPLMAMAMGSDPNSPLSLGPQTFNWPNLLSAIMQFCLAAIVAILVNSWMQRRPRIMMTRRQSVNSTSIAPSLQTPTLASAPVPTPVQTPPPRPPVPVSQPVTTPPTVARAAQPVTTPPTAARPATPPAATSVPAAQTTAAAPAVAQAARPPVQQPPVASPPPQPMVQSQPQPAPKPTPPVAAPPVKPKKPKQVYYNLVGEPIESDDDD
jgi:large-conductance mechanosensitive channel